MILNKPLESINIKDLNAIFKDSYLIIDTNLKKIILEKSFNERVMLMFKLIDKYEFEKLYFPNVDETGLFIIYKEEKNFRESVQIFDNLKFYKKLSSKHLSSTALKKNKYWFEKLSNMGLINNRKIYLDDKKKIYTIDNNYIESKDDNINLIKYDFEPVDEIEVLEYTNIENEILDIFNKISNLIYTGENPNDITIIAPKSYILKIMTLNHHYNLPINNQYKYKKRIQIKMEDIKNDFIGVEDVALRESIIKTFEKYIDYIDNSEFLMFFNNLINSNFVSERETFGGIKLGSIDNFQYDKKHIFVMGYNNVDFLKYEMDDKYFLDIDKETLNLLTSKDMNIIKNKTFKNIIEHIYKNSNTIISYSKKINKKTVSINTKFDFKLTIVNMDTINNSMRFSYSSDMYLLKKEINKYLTTKQVSKNYLILKDNISKSNIDFKMKQIKIDNLKIKDDLVLSSTLLEKYYKCQYKFYIENILKKKEKQKNYFSLHLGTYIHDMLEHVVNEYYNNDIKEYSLLKNIIKEYAKTIYNKDDLFKELMAEKKEYLFDKINKFIYEIVNTLIEQIKSENFKLFSLEEQIDIKYKEYNFTGKIDKVLRYNDYYMVIDYKTGNANLTLTDYELNNGLNLQNLIYFILLKEKYSEVKFGGTYRYKVMPKISDTKNYYLRNGYTNSDVDVCANINFDIYENLKKNKDGSLNYRSKSFNTEEFENKIKIVEKKIDEFIENIQNENVSFNTANKVDECLYCSYRSICYK